MKQILKLVLLLVFSQVAMAQAPSNYTNINGRYRWIAGMFDSTFHIPKGTSASLRTGGSTNAGALFYNTTDSTVYTYTGTQWIKLRGVVIDTTSLSNRINLKLNISDTASMLAPYLRKVDTASLSNRINLKLNISDTATMLGNYLNNVGYGLIKAGQIVTADSATLATYFLRRKDSLTTTNPLGYVTRKILADTAAAIRSADAGGTVTSVGLTMPVAFNVSNSPVTSSGTIAVTGAGLASQYVRGDGTLGDLPTGGGGGASVSYYMNGSVNQGTFGGNIYYELNKNPIIGAGTDFTINANGYIAQFLTDANDPALLNIPGGNWNLELYFSASSGGGTPSFYVELYKYNGTTFTLLASNSGSPEIITGGTAIDAYFTSLAVPTTTLALTDRLAIRVYVTHAGRTITLHTENSHLCQVITTFTTGLTALNGLTEQVQFFTTGTTGTDFNISSSIATHTFNLPTASATNRGALSSADWTTFNNKLNISDTANMLLPYLRKVDTASLSNRINTKLNISDTSTMLGNYVNNVGYGLSKVSQVVSADSATLASYFLRRKDSLTATNLLGYVTGKILADTAAAVRAAAGTIGGSGTTNRVSKFTASGTIGNSSIEDSSVVGVAMTISSFANVGIGTATPSSKLEVSGNATIKTNFASLNLDNTTSTSPVWMKINNGGGNYLIGAASNVGSSIITSTSPYALVINAESSRDVVIGTNNIERVRFDSTGKVGIGTTTIDSMLTVAEGARFQRGVRMSGLPSAPGTRALRIDANGTISVADTTTGGGGGIGGSGTINRLAKFTASGTIGNSSIADSSSSVAMTISSGGNVGIGTTSPSSKFDLVSSTNGNVFSITGLGGTLANFIVQGNGEQTMRFYNNASTGSARTSIKFANRLNTDWNWIMYNDASETGANNFTLQNHTNGVAYHINTSNQIGIGTLTVGSRFQVNGNAAIGYSASTAAPTNGLAVSGTFLVGTTDATNTDKARINNDGTSVYSTIRMSNANSTANMYVGVGGSAVSNTALRNNAYVWNAAATALAFGTSDVEAMRITSGGASASVGIGTSTIGSKLQVNGNAAIGYSASTAAPTNGLMVAGNVGVNVTPSAWASGFRAIQIGARTALFNSDINITTLGNNIFYDGVSYKYITSAAGSSIDLGGNYMTFGTLASGTAGATATGVERARIHTDGIFYIGNGDVAGSPNNGIVSATGGSGTNVAGAEFRIRGGASTGSGNGGAITFYTSTAGASGTTVRAGTEKMRITSDGQVTLATGANVSAIAQTGYSLTGSNASSLIDLAGTWNTTGNPTAIKLNITNTASGANSLLMDLQVGGTPEFRVTRTGNVVVNGSTSTYQMHVVGTGSLLALGEESFTTGRQMLFGIDGSGNGEIQSVHQGTSYRNLALNPLGGNVGIATSSPTSTLHANGSVAKAITTKTATYTLTSSDHTVIFNLNGNATANLPDATTCTGRIYMIKINRTNTTDTLTIDPNGTQTIDGFTTYALQCQYAVTIQSDGSNWQIVGDFGAGLNCL
jgi:hypothetical protein